MKIEVIAYTEPIPKGRPRFRIFRGHVSTYTPTKTAIYEKLIAETYKDQAQCFQFSREQALNVRLRFGLGIPKSTSKYKVKEMLAGLSKHIKKPDIDNLIKSVLDALNGIAWEDDAQIVRVTASKVYTNVPFVSITINEEVE